MEKDIREFETTIIIYNSNTETSFISNSVTLENELNEINIKLKELIESYAIGELSLNNIDFELDLLSNRLNVISLLVAA